jgi:hypothetical protein
MFVLFTYYNMMEKLLNLLNEYESESWIIKDWDIVKVGCDDYWLPCIDSYKQCIISKSYWFIDWLVKNDKIDYQKSPWEIMFDDRMWTMFSLEDSIVMMLSISQNTIDDLISYLK